MKYLLLTFCLFFNIISAQDIIPPKKFYAKVIGISDGDTFKVLYKKQIFKKIQWLETIDAIEEISENYYENGVSKERYKKNNENLIEMEKYYSNKAIKEILVIEDNKKKIKKYNKEGSLIREKILTNNIIKSEE